MQMDTSKGSGSEPENPIATCATMLRLRQFSACSVFARRLPSSERVGQILAIADVLSADDFYSVLQVHRADAGDRNLVRQHFSKLALLLDPKGTDKLPFSDEALARAREALHVLWDPKRRVLYDRELEQRGPDRTATFWTSCPYCWNMYLYGKMYEECTLLCQSCRKSFHGVPVMPPEMEGEDRKKYYWRHASVPLKYYEVKEKEDSKKVMGEQETPIVYISDDDDEEERLGKKVSEGLKGDVKSEGFESVVQGDVKNEGVEKVEGDVKSDGCERVVQGNETVELQGRGRRRWRIKTVANKGVWNRKKSREGSVDTDSDSDSDEKDA